MKKKYIAPTVCVERFELAEHIASCGDTNVTDGNNFGTPTHYDGNSCVFVSNGGEATMFLGDNDSCIMKIDPDDTYIGCYNTPDGTVSMFAS